MLYSGTPYLSDLQRQLGAKYSKLVHDEVRRFQKFQDQVRNTLDSEEADPNQKKNAKKWARRLPQNIRQSSAEFVGPEVLPHGETTEVMLTAFGSDGNRYILSFIALYCEPNGHWRYRGRRSIKGRLQQLEQEVKPYKGDDLAKFNSSIGNFIQGLDEFAERSFERFAQNPIGDLSGGGMFGDITTSDDGLLSIDEEDDDDVFSTSSSSYSSSYSSSAKKTLMQNAKATSDTTTFGSTSESLDDKVSGKKDKTYGARAVKTRLKRHSTKPDWYDRLRYRHSGADWQKFIREKAKPIYNQCVNQGETYRTMWKALKHHAKESDLL